MKALIIFILAAWAWVAYEIYISPFVDEDGNEIDKE